MGSVRELGGNERLEANGLRKEEELDGQKMSAFKGIVLVKFQAIRWVQM